MHRPKAVLLDRDGVINFDSPDYILTPEQWRPIPGSLQAIAALTHAGIPVAIVSNQSALGRGMFDAATMQAIHDRMIAAVEAAGGRIAHTAYCPHAPEDGCDCRKPKPGLLIDALQALGITDAKDTIMVGDSARDVEAAVAVGVRPVLVRTGYGDVQTILSKSRRLVPDIRVYDDLAAAVGTLLQEATCS
jgi:D-glycero-D-manno-heptose 1,7-bisphosphate phosphatase